MPDSGRAMRSQLVGPLLRLVRAAGGDLAALRAAHALPATAESDADVVLPLPRFRALLDDAERATGDGLLGVHLAESLSRGTYGILEFICTSSPTVGEAVRRVVRYIGLLNEIVDVSLVERGDEAVVEQRVAGEPLGLGRHANEFFIANLLIQISRLTGTPQRPLRAWFAHPAPKELPSLCEFLGSERVEFGAGANGVALPVAVLSLPIRSSDPPLLALLDGKAAEELARRTAGGSRFLGRVREVIRERLPNGAPTLNDAADATGMSARTLQRRLDDEGATFAALVESVRKELAELYLGDPTRPLGEVAYLLGYSELSAFLRAFKRWTGKTPTEFRGTG
jgi:AraC-like DNA-binding protein